VDSATGILVDTKLKLTIYSYIFFSSVISYQLVIKIHF